MMDGGMRRGLGVVIGNGVGIEGGERWGNG